MFHCGRAIYRAHLIIAPGMGAVMRCRGGCAFAPPAGARSARDHGGGIAKANAPKPHLSGQPGPDIAQAMYGRRPKISKNSLQGYVSRVYHRLGAVFTHLVEHL